MAGSSSLVTAISVLVFFWYVFNTSFTVFKLFYPTFQTPFTSQVHEPFHKQYWSEEQNFTLFLYTSVKPDPGYLFKKDAAGEYLKKPIWQLNNLSQNSKAIDETLTLPLPKKVRNNGTLYLHSFITREGLLPDQNQTNYDPLNLYARTSLTKYVKFRPNNTWSLLSEQNVAEKSNQVDAANQPILTHFKSFVQLEIVVDRNEYPLNGIPYDVATRLPLINPERKFYLPMFYFNEIGLRRDHLVPLNLTNPPKSFDVKLGFRSASLGMSRVHFLIENNFQALQRPDALLKVSEEEIDNMRQMFFEVAPTLLALTFLAAFLHLLFDFLAFKSDVSHWRSKDTLAGTSKASVVFSTIASILSALYLLDKRHETSVLVLIGAFATVLVELYKVMRVISLKNTSGNKNKTSRQIKAESEAAEVDSLVFKYTSVFSFPIAIAYASYTLVYQQYSSYYSWALEAVLALVYLFGFINMVPQVVINYRIKSVESVALGTFFFRAVNTFVDDLFALVIPMPPLVRLAAFRDDIIFFVFLYQWYAYPSRPEDEEENESKKKQ